jgi:hypothetical protein
MRDKRKALDTKIVGDLFIKYDLLFYKTLVVQFNIKYLVVVSQKNFFDTQKKENEFLCKEMENTQNEHCLTSREAHMCIIWGHFNKLFHGFGHDIAHLA